MKSFKIIFIIFLFILSSQVYSQESCTIKGTVTDFDDAPVQFANVSINELSISTLTDASGKFEFNNIQNGSYIIAISRTGFKILTSTINISSSSTEFNFRLVKSLIETPTIDVTSSFTPLDITQSSFSISALSLREYSKQRSQNLASTIENFPGVNNISTGSSIGKPVIRGLTSLGVIIVHDGVKHESQQWGDEHAPEISLYDVERIEILRGPASLVYGSDGIGGVVNIVSKPLQFTNKKNGIFYGAIDLGGFSVNDQATGNLSLGYGLKNFGVKGHIGFRSYKNTKTPDGNFVINTLEPDVKDTIQGGELSNSGGKEIEGGLTAELQGKFGHFDLGFESFNREIQIHEEDADATPNQKISTNQFELSGEINLKKNLTLEPILSYQLHDRKEFETNEDKEINFPALHLDLKTFQSDLRLHHELSKDISGTAGISFVSAENKTLAEEKLIPNYTSTSLGFYLSEKYQQKYFTLSLGGRFDTKKLNTKETVFESDSLGNPVSVIPDQELTFDAFSGSMGIVVRPSENFDIFANLGRGWRAPSEFELYVNGEHEGTGRIERGLLTLNPGSAPEPESSLNIDLGIRARFEKFNASISFFNNTINNFIFPSPTGEIDSSAMLPIYDILQSKSVFTGIEYSLQVQPFEFMLLSLNGDFLTAKNDATGNYLPFVPPAKNIIEVKFQSRNLGEMIYNPYINFSAKIVSAQNNVDPLEVKTEGYTLLKAGAGFDFVLGKSIASLDLSLDNIADLKYVDHLSRFKSYALNPGRSFNLKLSVPFSF